MSQALPMTPAALSTRRRATIGSTVLASRALSCLPPRRLREVLTTVAQGATPADYLQTRRVRDEVLTASALARGDSSCLMRSISTALVCRTEGLWPEWCVGVLNTPPFTAHAWLEAEGEIVDEPLTSSSFAKFFTVAAA